LLGLPGQTVIGQQDLVGLAGWQDRQFQPNKQPVQEQSYTVKCLQSESLPNSSIIWHVYDQQIGAIYTTLYT